VGASSKKVVIAALVANAVITGSKLVVGLVSGSAAMLAEAAHSFADCINQGFLLISIGLGDQPADEEHPYGYGKERFFWAFLAALFIFVAGSVFSFYEGLHKVWHPEEQTGELFWAYVVLAGSFVFDAVVLWIAMKAAIASAKAAGLPLRTFLAETSDTTLKTALYEDAAATLGVVLAGLGLYLSQRLGMPIFDGLASMAIGVVLVAVAILLGRESRRLLLGMAAPPRVRAKIREAVTGVAGVREVIALLTMQLGPESLLVTGEINVRGDLRTDEIEALLAEIQASIRAAEPGVRNIYLELHPAPGG
jgi:cation diffusion facilitator family transporter